MSYLIINYYYYYYYYWLIKGRSLWLAGCCNAHAQESSFSVGPRLLHSCSPSLSLSLSSVFFSSILPCFWSLWCLQPVLLAVHICSPSVAGLAPRSPALLRLLPFPQDQFLRRLCSLQWLLRLTAQGDQCLVCCKNSCKTVRLGPGIKMAYNMLQHRSKDKKNILNPDMASCPWVC